MSRKMLEGDSEEVTFEVRVKGQVEIYQIETEDVVYKVKKTETKCSLCILPKCLEFNL